MLFFSSEGKYCIFSSEFLKISDRKKSGKLYIMGENV